jgi:hypothetical protein
MEGKRDALIIATGAYEDQAFRRLRAPAQDAAAIDRVLRDPSIGNFRVQQIVDQPSHLLKRAIEEFFADRSLYDLLLVHLSCHGIKDDSGQLYFAASDTEKRLLGSSALSAAELNTFMERCRARSIVLLLDCCYSGAFLPGSKGDEGVHLKEKFEGRGRAILTATNAIEYAWEGEELSGEGQPSLFTAAIVDGLETGEADRDRDGVVSIDDLYDRDGVVSIDDLYDHVYERVQTVKPSQTPRKWALGIEKDLYVARNPHPVAPRSLPSGFKRAPVSRPPPHKRQGAPNTAGAERSARIGSTSPQGPLTTPSRSQMPRHPGEMTLVGLATKVSSTLPLGSRRKSAIDVYRERIELVREHVREELVASVGNIAPSRVVQQHLNAALSELAAIRGELVLDLKNLKTNARLDRGRAAGKRHIVRRAYQGRSAAARARADERVRIARREQRQAAPYELLRGDIDALTQWIKAQKSRMAAGMSLDTEPPLPKPLPRTLPSSVVVIVAMVIGAMLLLVILRMHH